MSDMYLLGVLSLIPYLLGVLCHLRNLFCLPGEVCQGEIYPKAKKKSSYLLPVYDRLPCAEKDQDNDCRPDDYTAYDGSWHRHGRRRVIRERQKRPNAEPDCLKAKYYLNNAQPLFIRIAESDQEYAYCNAYQILRVLSPACHQSRREIVFVIDSQ